MATMKPSLTLIDDTPEQGTLPRDGAAPPHPPFAVGTDEDLNSHLHAMRQMLESVPHASPAEALAMLRQAFPDVELSDRVRALGYREET